MITVEGKNGIKATVLADSVSEAGIRMLSMEIEYPRLVLSELNTHRMLSKNSFSSRAVPFAKMIEQLNGRPVRFGANQAGMQDKGEDYNAPLYAVNDDGTQNLNCLLQATPAEWWEENKRIATYRAEIGYAAGYHKQVYNRLLEPFQMMKTVISGTEWCNFFWLRDHDAADPTLAELARVMREAKEQSVPIKLRAGDWHLPYLDFYQEVVGCTEDDALILGPQVFYIGDMEGDDFQVLTLEEAIKVSCARCAAVSYRNEGYDLAKSLEVYDRLVGDDRKHASAFEHQATPMKQHLGTAMSICGRVNLPFCPDTWEDGISHVDRKGNLWSGNIRGYIQYRKLIKGENYIEDHNKME